MAVERDGKVIEIEKVSFASPQVNKQIKLKDRISQMYIFTFICLEQSRLLVKLYQQLTYQL